MEDPNATEFYAEVQEAMHMPETHDGKLKVCCMIFDLTDTRKVTQKAMNVKLFCGLLSATVGVLETIVLNQADAEMEWLTIFGVWVFFTACIPVAGTILSLYPHESGLRVASCTILILFLDHLLRDIVFYVFLGRKASLDSAVSQIALVSSILVLGILVGTMFLVRQLLAWDLTSSPFIPTALPVGFYRENSNSGQQITS